MAAGTNVIHNLVVGVANGKIVKGPAKKRRQTDLFHGPKASIPGLAMLPTQEQVMILFLNLPVRIFI